MARLSDESAPYPAGHCPVSRRCFAAHPLPIRLGRIRAHLDSSPRPPGSKPDGGRDGRHFDRTFMEAYLRPGLDPQNWGHAHGNMTMAWGMLPTGPEELSLYWAEHYGEIPQLRRGVVRLDGFTSVQAPYTGGECITPALAISVSQLRHCIFARIRPN